MFLFGARPVFLCGQCVRARGLGLGVKDIRPLARGGDGPLFPSYCSGTRFFLRGGGDLSFCVSVCWASTLKFSLLPYADPNGRFL